MNGICFRGGIFQTGHNCNFNLEFGYLFNERTELSNVTMIGPLVVRTVIGLATDCKEVGGRPTTVEMLK
jgi:hypothetical protein